MALSKSCNINEASAALNKAQELIIKYNVSLNQSNLIEDIIDFTDIGCYLDLFESGNVPTWKIELANTLAYYNFCFVYKKEDKYGNQAFCIAGTETNGRTAIYMYNYLVRQISSHKAIGNIENYYMGMVRHLKSKMEDNTIELMTEGDGQFVSSIIYQREQINKWANLKFRNKKTYKHIQYNKNSYIRGLKAAKNISINRPKLMIGS